MIVAANIWRPGATVDEDGDLYEGQRVEVERTDDNEIAIHVRLASDDWGTSIYVTRTWAGFLAAALLEAAS